MKVIDILTKFDNLEDESIIIIFIKKKSRIYSFKELYNYDNFKNIRELNVIKFELSLIRSISTNINIYCE